MHTWRRDSPATKLGLTTRVVWHWKRTTAVERTVESLAFEVSRLFKVMKVSGWGVGAGWVYEYRGRVPTLSFVDRFLTVTVAALTGHNYLSSRKEFSDLRQASISKATGEYWGFHLYSDSFILIWFCYPGHPPWPCHLAVSITHNYGGTCQTSFPSSPQAVCTLVHCSWPSRWTWMCLNVQDRLNKYGGLQVFQFCLHNLLSMTAMVIILKYSILCKRIRQKAKNKLYLQCTVGVHSHRPQVPDWSELAVRRRCFIILWWIVNSIMVYDWKNKLPNTAPS